MILTVLNSEYKKTWSYDLNIINRDPDSIYDARNELIEGRDVTRRITWRGHDGLKQYLQLRYGVVTDSDDTNLLIKFDKGVRNVDRSGFNYVDVTVRRLNKSEALEASTWLESKLPKYNMLDIKPPFDIV